MNFKLGFNSCIKLQRLSFSSVKLKYSDYLYKKKAQETGFLCCSLPYNRNIEDWKFCSSVLSFFFISMEHPIVLDPCTRTFTSVVWRSKIIYRLRTGSRTGCNVPWKVFLEKHILKRAVVNVPFLQIYANSILLYGWTRQNGITKIFSAFICESILCVYSASLVSYWIVLFFFLPRFLMYNTPGKDGMVQKSL